MAGFKYGSTNSDKSVARPGATDQLINVAFASDVGFSVCPIFGAGMQAFHLGAVRSILDSTLPSETFRLGDRPRHAHIRPLPLVALYHRTG